MTLSVTQKETIINKYKMNISIKQIAIDMGLNKNTIQLWIKRYKLCMSLDRKNGSGIKIVDKNKVVNN